VSLSHKGKGHRVLITLKSLSPLIYTRFLIITNSSFPQSGYIVNKESNNKHDNGERHPKHFIADTSVRTHNSNLDLKFHDFDAQVRDGSYPLHIALINGASNEVIHTLVEVGSEVLEMRNKFGKTPLDVAKELNHDETTLSLLQTI